MNDDDLIRQVRSHNSDATRFMMEKYQNLVWHIILRMVGNESIAEDLYQEVFFRIIKNLHKFEGNSKLSTWIGSIAFNVSSDYLRKKKHIRLFEERSSRENLMKAHFAISPADSFDRQELKWMVRKIINELPVSYKLVITMFHLQELSLKEIAEITSMPEGTIKSYLNRGRKLIREKILEIYPELEQHVNEFIA